MRLDCSAFSDFMDNEGPHCLFKNEFYMAFGIIYFLSSTLTFGLSLTVLAVATTIKQASYYSAMEVSTAATVAFNRMQLERVYGVFLVSVRDREIPTYASWYRETLVKLSLSRRITKAGARLNLVLTGRQLRYRVGSVCCHLRWVAQQGQIHALGVRS